LEEPGPQPGFNV